jgi:hypothetical protein
MTKDRQNPDQLEQRGPNDEQNNAVKRMLLPRSALLYRTAVSESSRSVLTERVTVKGKLSNVSAPIDTRRQRTTNYDTRLETRKEHRSRRMYQMD